MLLQFWIFRRVTVLGFLTLVAYLWFLDLLASFHFELLAYFVSIIRQYTKRVNIYALNFSYIFQVLFFQSHFYFDNRLIELSRDVEENLELKSRPDKSFSIFQWNLNSITAYNFRNFDIIRLSETYLNSDISSDNENWVHREIMRVVWPDHPSDDKEVVFPFILKPLYHYRY